MLGESAGRSAGNLPRASARRRNSEAERSQAMHLYDDPNAWPDEPLLRRNWRRWSFDITVGVCAATWILLLLALAEFSWGWLARIAYGFVIFSFVALALAAYGSDGRRRSS